MGPRPLELLTERLGTALAYPLAAFAQRHRAGDEAMFRTDSHIAGAGSWECYLAILAQLGLAHDPALERRAWRPVLFSGDLGRRFSPRIAELIHYPVDPLVYELVDDDSERVFASGGHLGARRVLRCAGAPYDATAVVFGDSFMWLDPRRPGGLGELLAATFRETHVVWAPMRIDPGYVERVGAFWTLRPSGGRDWRRCLVPGALQRRRARRRELAVTGLIRPRRCGARSTGRGPLCDGPAPSRRTAPCGCATTGGCSCSAGRTTPWRRRPAPSRASRSSSRRTMVAAATSTGCSPSWGPPGRRRPRFDDRNPANGWSGVVTVVAPRAGQCVRRRKPRGFWVSSMRSRQGSTTKSSRVVRNASSASVGPGPKFGNTGRPPTSVSSTISETLASILSQPLPDGWDVEVCISDNGSRDATAEVVRRHPRLSGKAIHAQFGAAHRVT